MYIVQFVIDLLAQCSGSSAAWDSMSCIQIILIPLHSAIALSLSFSLWQHINFTSQTCLPKNNCMAPGCLNNTVVLSIVQSFPAHIFGLKWIRPQAEHSKRLRHRPRTVVIEVICARVLEIKYGQEWFLNHCPQLLSPQTQPEDDGRRDVDDITAKNRYGWVWELNASTPTVSSSCGTQQQQTVENSQSATCVIL